MNVRDAMVRTVEWEFSQSNYAAVLEDVPPTLFRYWAETSQGEFPGIPRDPSFYVQATEGLMMFFDCAAAAARPCGLPSRAADSVWHAWVRMDAAGLERFCIRHFGRAIPHVDKARMRQDMDKALAACLVQGRRRASRPVTGPSLPSLFSLDWRVGMPHGFGYRMVGEHVACFALDGLGNAESGVSLPRVFTPHGLFQAGLISEAEYRNAAHLDRKLASIGGGLVLDGDSGAGDGAASCSGGSACGGGCGGGGCGS